MPAGMGTQQEEHVSKQPDYWILLLMHIEHFHPSSAPILQ